MGDDSGWKQIHGDVFRKPEQAELYAALVGTGTQLMLLVVLIILISWIGDLYLDNGSTITVFIVAFALTSFISGYVSGGIYQSFYYPVKSPGWIKNLVLTATVFPMVIFGVCFMLNFISMYYQTQNAIPFGTMVVMLTIWGLVSLPLVVAGTLVGRNWNGTSDAVCRINPLPRPIPLPKWYLQPNFIVLASGLLPFGCIFIEVYFILTSFWNYKIYYVYGFMLLVFLIVTIVTVCVTIVGTYFLLNAENYNWHWTSFWSGASISLYVFLYSVYYFVSKTEMSGFLQTMFYFGYMGLFSFALAILCGTIGNRGTALFVKVIYRNIKVD
jgi:transmembrane 9 superfamily protein 3